MLKVTLRSIWEHKRRLVLTIISIVLGVSFMAGTFVLNDSFNRLFDDLFADRQRERRHRGARRGALQRPASAAATSAP